MHSHTLAGGGHGSDPVPPPEPDPDPDPVIVLRWPAQSDLRASLVAEHVPRLLLLEDGTAPPLVWDDLEDWIRPTAGPVEVAARSARLGARAGTAPAVPQMPLPLLDADGLLQAADGREIHLDSIETRLVHLLLERCDHVVRRDDLRTAGWPSGRVTDRAVDGRISRLRRRIGAVGLQITTIRGSGYLLERTRPR